MYELYQMMPIIPLYDIGGNWGSTVGGPPDLGNVTNPVAMQRSTKDNRHNAWDINGNVYAEVDFLSHFTVRTSFGGTVDNQYYQNFYPIRYWEPNSVGLPNSYSESASYGTSYT
jgi:hypothetical protein